MGPNRTLLAAVMASLALGLPEALAAPPPQEQPDDPVTAHAEPRWLKGNLHTHSLWSDGNDYPEMIVDWYARHGYQFLALSDHNVLSQGPRWMGVAEANKRAEAGRLRPLPQAVRGRLGRDPHRWTATSRSGSSRWASSATSSSGPAGSC